VHAGVADAVIGPVNAQQSDAAETQHHLALGRLIAGCPDLAATLVPESELTHMQLQKLAVNAVINPLTVVFDCLNGALFQSDPIRALIRCLVAEIAAVLQAITRSRSAPPDAAKMASFAAQTLYTSIAAVGKRTAQNISSMRQDRRAGRQTEIDYINGYIVAEGARQGVACPLNAKLIHVVKEEKRLSTADIAGVFHT
jgi:2-dehydropantoate 2-reductase